MTKTLLIIAGEASGDKHAAHLVKSLKGMGDVRVLGVGGDRMREAGVELIHHVKEMAVMGFTDVVSRLPFFRKVRRDLLNAIRAEHPSAVILVDYPGFNLRFAGLAKKSDTKVIYFISPQIWAWGKKRMSKIKRTVDLMLTIFRFEEDMYRREGVNAHFVGHPLLDEMRPRDGHEIEEFRKAHCSGSDSRLLALLPGSRLQEVKRILPTMLRSVDLLRKELASVGVTLEVVAGRAPGIDESVYRDIVRSSGVDVKLAGDSDLLMSAADAGMVKSGTATLEAALHDLPMLVVYKTGTLNYLIGRMLVKLDSISLVNIVAGTKIVEELVQNQFTPARASELLKDIFMKPAVMDEIRRKYSDLRKILGNKGASDRAAELILKAI